MSWLHGSGYDVALMTDMFRYALPCLTAMGLDKTFRCEQTCLDMTFSV